MNTVVTSLPLSPSGAASASAGTGLSRQFKRLGAACWRALEAAGQARAHRHLLEYADQCERLQPELAKELRAAIRQGPMA